VKKIALIPTLFTLGNGVCGFASLTFAIKAAVDPPGLNHLATAGWLVLAAMLFDLLDGHMARFAKSTTDFGGQLDSLCDVISFGVAPGFLILHLSADFHPRVLWVIAVLYVLCVLLRLARFNCENTHELTGHLTFAGLPSPAAGGTIAAFAIMLHAVSGDPDSVGLIPPLVDAVAPFLEVAKIFVPLMAATMALLMVSRIPYPHVLNQMAVGHHSFGHLVRLIFAGVTIMLIQELALPLLFSVFVLGAPLRFIWEDLVRRRPREQPLY
jgi:CDP-diacylglycerol--serine O-phosphatidyltransferase